MPKKIPTPIQNENEAAETYPSTHATSPGRTTVTPEVLLTIARLTTLDTPGVSKMGTIASGVNCIFNRGLGEGVRIHVKDDRVSADLYVILKHNVNIRDVSRKIQQNVSRALTEMVGMHVDRINIHVEDMDYPEVEEAAAP